MVIFSFFYCVITIKGVTSDKIRQSTICIYSNTFRISNFFYHVSRFSVIQISKFLLLLHKRQNEPGIRPLLTFHMNGTVHTFNNGFRK